jgi:predicted Fe-Mo cluster-binding NifX family protein
MRRKMLIVLQGDFVAQRFDLATELLIAEIDRGKLLGSPKTIIMERPGEEELCQMIIRSEISEVICGGIEETPYNFLVWKKVQIIDAVIGSWQAALDKAVAGDLLPREILPDCSGLKL